MSLPRILGVVLVCLGVVMAVFPGWFGSLTGGAEPATDTFQAIERRIRGGMVLGVGLVFLARTSLRPWSTFVPTVAVYFVAGALVVRLMGLMVDGHDARQWMWVAGEALVVGVAAVWLWRVGVVA
ncbi:MAG: hypothetical protein KF689_02820 [Gemmatimonadaceae bacterium]|nr:hypothetical protein [Gemmatimonadaceae bacterium]MCW5827664.1 hypothetical protein [Gemmatimonadaceae bacterium]